MAASKRGLRPATIPTGTATATANTTATSTWVNVSIVSYQMPDVSVGTWSPATISVQIATVAATRRPPLAHPIPVTAPATAHHGASVRKSRIGVSTFVTTKSLIDWRKATLSLIHSTASLIGRTMSQCTDDGNEPAPTALAITTTATARPVPAS